MKALFTLSEMAVNAVANGKQVYVRDETGALILRTIDYVKLLKDLRLAELHFTDGEPVQISEDEELMFDVNKAKKFSRGPVKRLRGRDVWGTEEIER